ncbi:MAG: hypothetical protein JSR36_09655 [Proteobacteria bacterium]|nr:hypothetical protein [Pseudomonadota bacterium]
MPCESCHANAIFKGTSHACGACHGIGTEVRASAKPANHILSTDQCDACHTAIGWSPAVNFDHTQARGSCSTCHNGVQAQGKGPTHIVTDLECDACHSTLTWAGAVFTHQGVTGNCASCHNGVAAKGMPANHIPVGSTPCEGCHSPTNFVSFAGTTINHLAVTALTCASCHETAAFLGMTPSTSTAAHDSRPNATLDKNHPATGDCVQCHDTTSFGSSALRPANHIPTNAPCSQCHTTPGNYSQYSVAGVHQGATACLSCHGPGTGPFANVTIVSMPGNHIPVGTLDCNGAGCHSATNVNPGGFKIGAASLATPTLNIAGHSTVAGAVPACQTCHENAPYVGMLPSSSSAAGDSRPTAFDKNHPTTGDCGGCHTTTPTFTTNVVSGSKPANHIPTTAPCTQCHTTGDTSVYSVVGTHQGVTECLSCHAQNVGPFANVTMVTTPGNHIPIGSLDCSGSGCHSTKNVNAGGFKIGTASITVPTLSVAGHSTVAAAVAACQTCHESAAFAGMLASTASTAGDSRPTALDKSHPTSGDCGGCHTTTPTFAANVTQSGKPANHIPTSAPCAQCHTTVGNYALYSVTGTHQGVTSCLSCHAPAVATTFDNVTIVSTPANHIPIGSLDCNGSGCHTTANVSAGGFKLGAANISSPTLNVAGHATVGAAVPACAACHESAGYAGMLPSSASTAADSRPTAFDSKHPATGDCGNCHVTTPTFATNLLPTAPKPANHIPTTAVCAQCHTTAGNFAVYSVTGVHQGVTGCLTCHAPTVANTFVNVTIVSTPANHFPIGNLDCNGSGCHTTKNVNTGGFRLGAASIGTPTLNVAGHTTVAAAVTGCQTCHETAPYVGMLASTATTAGDSRPTALDKAHPTTGDCNGCHTTTPTFANNQTGNAKPANHIPTTAACAQCHTTAGNFALYSVTGTHQGATKCLTCHAPAVAGTFANITIVSTPSNHFPIGSLDCNGSGCHTINNVNPGGFKLGNPSISTPTLTVAGHTTIAAAVSSCQTCHESALYAGMIASSATAAGDSRPTALDKAHPTTGDCGGCHTTTPTFATNQSAGAKPANHIPTTAACTQCHTTPGNYSAYSVTGVHQGVTKCLACHAPTVANTFANIVIVSTPSNHFPIGSLDCNGSGCHTTTNVNPGGFKIGSANVSAPTLTVAGHTTIASAVSGCQTCHETAPYAGMVASTATTAGDSRPTALDKAHPTSGDCNGCHTTTPTFTSNVTSAVKPANHIPTSAPCAQCHTTAGNYALYVMGATGHKGITGNCAQCHAYGLSFYNMAPPTLVQPPSGATGHIPAVPPNGTAAIACELCHSPSAFTTFSGTVMKHAYVTSMKCMSCHEYGMKWKTNTGVRLWVRDGPDHHPGQDCNGSGCHTSRDKFAVRPVIGRTTTAATATSGTTNARSGVPAPRPTVGGPGSRALVGGAVLSTGSGAEASLGHPPASGRSCVSCHAGSAATGKPAGHIVASDNCQACHTMLAWLPLRAIDHSQVRGACAGCHNGTTATGKPARHLPTSAGCERCHTTNAWTPARFDHAAVLPHSCNSCHNSVQAIGLPRAHVPTTQQCDTCHGTLGWRPAKVDHTALTTSCTSCHNNIAALGIGAGHLTTRLDCRTCHTYPDWDVLHFRHASAAYPGTHRKALSCVSCHTTGSEQVPYAMPAEAGTCAGCHARDFRPAAHPKVVNGEMYAVSELANCTGACHVYSDPTQSKIAKSKPGPYHRVSDAAFKH